MAPTSFALNASSNKRLHPVRVRQMGHGALAFHQTGRNSGVLHSGIYYRPGSLRAVNCREGKVLLEQFCDEHGVAWDQTGKVVVATSESQVPALETIYGRGQENGVRCEMIDKARLDELEPHTAGIRAIHVPEAGIVDYPGVCKKLGELLEASGTEIRLQSRVTGIEQSTDHVTIKTQDVAKIERIVSPLLSADFGGPIAMQMTADATGGQPRQPYFLISGSVDSTPPRTERGVALIHARSEAPIISLYRRITGLLLRETDF